MLNWWKDTRWWYRD